MKTSRKQPKALTFMFLTEMWERFGFYVIQGLLVLYMTEYYRFSDSQSYTVLGVFTSLVYISPILGGILADKLLGFKTSIIWGGLFLVLGYALLAFSANPLFFYPSLAVIIVGNGFFKPNISSMLGKQYRANDPRRESGFTFFYIGINIGAFLAGISSGYIKDYFGWQTSFALASAGLIIGLMTFFYGLHFIHNEKHQPLSSLVKLQLLVYTILAVVGVNLILKIHLLADWLLPSVGLFLLIFLGILTTKQSGNSRKQLMTLNLLIVSSLVFWVLYFQLFFSATLYIERLVNKNVFGLHLTTTVFYASESVFIVLLGPVFAWLWNTLSHRGSNPSAMSKFILGIVFAGLGFLVLSISTLFPGSDGLINPFWIFFGYLLLTTGELLLSPIGLSAVTQLSPPHLTGMMMGVWFVATGFGGILAGIAAKLASIPSTIVDTPEMLAIYHHAFITYAYLAFIVALLLFLIRLATKRLLSSSIFD